MSSTPSPAPKQQLRARVLTNTIVVIGGRAIAIGFSAVATSLLARYLGSEELGEFSAVFAYMSLFGYWCWWPSRRSKRSSHHCDCPVWFFEWIYNSGTAWES